MSTTFGECPICHQGQLLVVKGVVLNRLLLMCDDCESQWSSPQATQSYENALHVEQQVVDASEEEISAAGWDKWVK